MMSEQNDLMKEKRELIQKMLKMQEKFRELSEAGGIDPAEYYNPPAGSPLDGYVNEYNDIASRVNQLAHVIKNSGHIH